ncbi:hypothetical protein [Paenibacillus xylanexedens]|nr:hypothetical protein [Paenibacillus xylanexedens]
MFEGDKLVDGKFLVEMKNDVWKGGGVMEGYIDRKKGEDCWIIAGYGVW